jgi:hypothetical protein
MLTRIGALVGCYCGNPHDPQIVAEGFRKSLPQPSARQNRNDRAAVWKDLTRACFGCARSGAVLRKPILAQRIRDVPVAGRGDRNWHVLLSSLIAFQFRTAASIALGV